MTGGSRLLTKPPKVTPMNITTHHKIDQSLCGTPLVVEKGFSRVQLETGKCMAADETGLIHGGFIFGLADYAAMIAVNHPHVVLGGARVKFLKPVKTGDVVVAEARATIGNETKKSVAVTVCRGRTTVFEGVFTCFVLETHVLAPG